MVSPLVIVSKGEDPYHTTIMALNNLPLPDLANKRILIKPNAARLASPGDGITTHPTVVSATIDHLRELGAKDIVIGEGCIFGVDAREAFQLTGMTEIAGKKDLKIIDLDRFGPVELAIPQGKLLKKVKVSSFLKDIDWIVSIPAMKTHMHTRVSLSIKNMKGILWRREKAKLHHLRANARITRGDKELDLAIAEMATILMPDLAVIDGTVGMEGMGPAYGKPKEMGIVLVSNYPLSADAVAARLMGFSPEEIPHLRLAAERGLGEIQLQNISVEPQDYLKWEDHFDPPPAKFSIPFPDVVVYDEGSCSACLSTLLLFLQKYHQEIDDYRLADKKFHVGIGKYLDSCLEGTILMGNCTSNLKKRGIFIKGCPPISSQIMRTLLLKKTKV
jgi:uncharacterized protein (DUF362 family)